MRRDGGGSSNGFNIEVADFVLHSEKGGAKTEAYNAWEEPVGWIPLEEAEGEEGGCEVEKDPEPRIMVSILFGVVELPIHGEKEEETDDDFCNFHERGFAGGYE